MTNSVIELFSDKIRSQEDLETAIEKELPHYKSKKEGIKLVPLYDNPRLKSEGEDGLSWKLNENTFEITAYTHATVRHELEHIFDGHLDRGNLDERKGFQKILGHFLYYAYYEPKAILHSLRIRI